MQLPQKFSTTYLKTMEYGRVLVSTVKIPQFNSGDYYYETLVFPVIRWEYGDATKIDYNEISNLTKKIWNCNEQQAFIQHTTVVNNILLEG